MPLTEASLSLWLFAFARLAGWTLFDPLTGRLPLVLRLMLAAVLAAVLAPGLAIEANRPFTVQGMLALSLEIVWGAALALCVWLVFAAVSGSAGVDRPHRNRRPADADRRAGGAGGRRLARAGRVAGGNGVSGGQWPSADRRCAARQLSRHAGRRPACHGRPASTGRSGRLAVRHRAAAGLAAGGAGAADSAGASASWRAPRRGWTCFRSDWASPRWD